jgi:hypothetical protein
MKMKDSFRKLIENATVRIKIENIDLDWNKYKFIWEEKQFYNYIIINLY